MYHSLDIDVPEEAIELLQALLDGVRPLGLEIRDGTLKAPPGAPAVAPGRVHVDAWFEGEAEAAEAMHLVRREFAEARVACRPIASEDWSESWKKHVRAIRVGKLWVGPPWEVAQAGNAAVQVVIEPGMAFGTGDHPTTAMCLEEVARVLQAQPGARVLDVGCGSGVLAIAARKLGAGEACGNDIDPVAVRVARENAALNGVPEVTFSDQPVERLAGTYDLVVANLFANVLCQLAPKLCDRTAAPDGLLAVSGILAPQGQEVLDAFAREGMRLTRRESQGEWVLFGFAHAP